MKANSSSCAWALKSVNICEEQFITNNSNITACNLWISGRSNEVFVWAQNCGKMHSGWIFHLFIHAFVIWPFILVCAKRWKFIRQLFSVKKAREKKLMEKFWINIFPLLLPLFSYHLHLNSLKLMNGIENFFSLLILRILMKIIEYFSQYQCFNMGSSQSNSDEML